MIGWPGGYAPLSKEAERLAGVMLQRLPPDERSFAFVPGPLILEGPWDEIAARSARRVLTWEAERSWDGTGFVYALTFELMAGLAQSLLG